MKEEFRCSHVHFAGWVRHDNDWKTRLSEFFRRIAQDRGDVHRTGLIKWKWKFRDETMGALLSDLTIFTVNVEFEFDSRGFHIRFGNLEGEIYRSVSFVEEQSADG